MLGTNSVFLVVLLLLGRKAKKKSLKLSKFITETTKSEIWNIRKVKWSLACNNIPISGPILLEKAQEFAKAFSCNYFTASNGWLLKRILFLSLYNTLHREETSPAYNFRHLAEIIWTPINRKLMQLEKILNSLRNSIYMSSTVLQILWKSFAPQTPKTNDQRLSTHCENIWKLNIQ